MRRDVSIPALTLVLAPILACRTAEAPAAPEPAPEVEADAEAPAEPDPAPRRRQATAVERMEGYFPNTALVTHDGREVRFYDDLIRDKVVLINFMYTTCDGI